jgi:beta-galactosidase/beta-glucuronidase
LNGKWEFAIDVLGLALRPEEIAFSTTIRVPFAPEAPLSGIGETGLYKACWYRRQVNIPGDLAESERLVLRFGAVDYEATVYLDGVPACSHEGGYTPFAVDITDYVRGKGEVTLAVRVQDDPLDLAKPRGKQDWQLHPHSIWYPRTTGIWQTVWIERLPETHVQSLRWTASLQRWEIGLEVRVARGKHPALRLAVVLRVGEVVLADDTYAVTGDEVQRRIALSDPGIDDFRNLLLWSPDMPTLITADLRLVEESGKVLDHVQSYTALRAVAVQGDRLVLNGRPFPLRLVLDQGYWPDGGMTAPSDAAIRRDVELVKQMGFNGVRKHQKLEDPRYLYWADRLGLVVWEEMPSAYRFTSRSIQRIATQWIDAIQRDLSHPCIICWVPFNESWGIPNLPDNAAERHYVQSMYHLTKSLDPSRPVIGNDGWETTVTDIVGIHDYDSDPSRIAQRYFTYDLLPKTLQRERPGGRILILEGHSASSLPIVLSEFGGIALARSDEPAWGYSRCRSAEELATRYAALLEAVARLQVFAGFCYTQFADTYQEANGLLYSDRTPKFPLTKIFRATRCGAVEPTSPPGSADRTVDAPSGTSDPTRGRP